MLREIMAGVALSSVTTSGEMRFGNEFLPDLNGLRLRSSPLIVPNIVRAVLNKLWG